ncbi:DEAD/DEAH box helicase [Candidatus Sumerlaeota bacterium]|nr:DEAD/DEAH box helicase [Candidatus Sumerlaeota bacterium]
MIEMNVRSFLDEIRSDPGYRGQIVFVREEERREAVYAETRLPLAPEARRVLDARGIGRLYSHQAEAIDAAREGENPLVVTGTASGKSLCYVVPILEMLLRGSGTGVPPVSYEDDMHSQGREQKRERERGEHEQDAHATSHGRDAHATRPRALLLFPTKALCQDQFRGFGAALEAAGLGDVLAGVYDGDTPASLRRKLRDHASVLFTNPDMLHASTLPQHARWAAFLKDLEIVVVDELHTYSGMFGSNAANLFRRLRRVCEHYGSAPRFIACSATVGNPRELAEGVLGCETTPIDRDGSPRGRRFYVLWNPPRVRRGDWRSRRSANVEAHELMAALIRRGTPTIAFSKAKMTAEMIHRYVCENLEQTAPDLASKVTPYRGGYLPEERREIERRLFDGELLGVSATRALELGIDVGGLDACILVGYPGTLASFFQQGGRAGRQDRDSLVILIGLDTVANQYVMSRPDYLFGRRVEQGVIDPDNPYVLTGHLRCAAHEIPLRDDEVDRFGPFARMVLEVLEENRKVRHSRGAWYHLASETPQHEVSLRYAADVDVLIEDADTGRVLGSIDKFDAPPILHPEAIYMHRGETYRVLSLDIDVKNLARVKRVEVDYYTQPLGGTDVHHVDRRLRDKPFGSGDAYWGEVTAYFRTAMYEKVHFYSLDAISRHGVDLPTFVLETMAFWIVPPDELMERVRAEGLDAHSGLRGIGYATRMLLPLFMTCDTLDFSHSVGAVNSPWNAVFVYERFPHGLGFTEKAYDSLGELMPAVAETIRNCPCMEGCPCCVGKPLRQYTTWNPERGEGSIPSKRAALMILDGLLGDRKILSHSDRHALGDKEEATDERLRAGLRRRLERSREPEFFHGIEPQIETSAPVPEASETLAQPDATRRIRVKNDLGRRLRKRLAKKIDDGTLLPGEGLPAPPPGMKHREAAVRPTDFPGQPNKPRETVPASGDPSGPALAGSGDPLAARARDRLRKRRPRE